MQNPAQEQHNYLLAGRLAPRNAFAPALGLLAVVLAASLPTGGRLPTCMQNGNTDKRQCGTTRASQYLCSLPWQYSAHELQTWRARARCQRRTRCEPAESVTGHMEPAQASTSMLHLLQAVKAECARCFVDAKTGVVSAACNFLLLAHNLPTTTAGKKANETARMHTLTDLVVVLAEVVLAALAA